jgi:HEAT repeat protein
LGDLADARGVEPLIAALEDEESVRSAAARALIDFRDPRAVEPMIKALGYTDYYTRHFAIIALRELKDDRAVPSLVLMLRDKNVWDTAAHVLGRFGEPAREPLEQALAMESEDSPLRARIEKALQLVNETIHNKTPLDALHSSDKEIRWQAFETVKDAKDIETLVAYLHNPSDNDLYRVTVETLAEIGGARVVEDLIPHIARISYTVVEALAKIGEPSVEPLIRFVREGDAESWVKESAIMALARVADERALELFIAILEDETASMTRKRAAVQGLGRIRDRRASEFLVREFMKTVQFWIPDYDTVIFTALQNQSALDLLIAPLIESLAVGDDFSVRRSKSVLRQITNTDPKLAGVIREKLQERGFTLD